MVIEKFLALSMIAFGLSASAAEMPPVEQTRQGAGRGARRRVRWLRQHLNRRSGRGESAANERHGMESPD